MLIKLSVLCCIIAGCLLMGGCPPATPPGVSSENSMTLEYDELFGDIIHVSIEGTYNPNRCVAYVLDFPLEDGDITNETSNAEKTKGYPRFKLSGSSSFSQQAFISNSTRTGNDERLRTQGYTGLVICQAGSHSWELRVEAKSKLAYKSSSDDSNSTGGAAGGGGGGGGLPPSDPSNLSAFPIAMQVNLTWNHNNIGDEEDEFIIEQAVDDGSPDYVEIGTVGQNVFDYQDTAGVSGTNYIYRVKARNSSGDSGYATSPSIQFP